MKKSLCFAFMFVFLAAVSAKAVVIHWAVTSLPTGATSAQLVYVPSGTPAYSATGSPPEPTNAGSANIGDYVSGLAVTPSGIGEQNSVDSATRSEGNYYVVLFNSDVSQFAYSTTPLAWNDSDSITEDELTPADTTYDPASFSSWTPVPEPVSAAMLVLGFGLLALRRRKRS